MKRELYTSPEFETDVSIFANLPICTQGVEGFEDGTIVGSITNVRLEGNKVKTDIVIDDSKLKKIINGI